MVLAASCTYVKEYIINQKSVALYSYKGPYTRAQKHASKASRGKKPAAALVRKMKIQSCFPFAMATRIKTFSTLRSCNQETNNTEAWTTHIVCQVIRFIPPVFLNYLSITNNNNGLTVSKAFTSK